jgi:hypothetical protein
MEGDPMYHVLALFALLRPTRVLGALIRHTVSIFVLILLGLATVPVQAEPES